MSLARGRPESEGEVVVLESVAAAIRVEIGAAPDIIAAGIVDALGLPA